MASINASTSGAGGVITTADNTGTLQLQSASTTVATINGFGIGLGTGVPSSGIGITFPATQSASSDANTLDDYEEGTFTPYLSDGTNSVALNGGSVYIKIGRMVYVAINGYNTNFSTLGASSHLRITGLPFTATAVNAIQVNLATNNTSTSSCVVEIYNSTIAYVYLANNTIDYNNATRNNLVGGASTFSFRSGFFYFASA